MSYFLGIDVGTSSVKSMLMAPDGRILEIAQSHYDVICPQPSWAEIPADILWGATCQTLRELSAKQPTAIEEVEAISFSGQMHSMILLDEEYRPLRNAITWLDMRAKAEAAELDGLAREKEYHDVLLNTITPGFFICFLRWLQRCEPQTLARAKKALLVKDYIRYKLCGEIGSDYSDAASTLCFDQVHRHWAWDMIDYLGLSRDLFAEKVCNAHEVAGAVTREAAEATGLKEGTLVCYGGGDTLMNHIGNGLFPGDGRILSTIGTSSHVSTGLESPLFDPLGRGATYCHALPDRWLMLVGGTNGGIVMKWLKNNVLGKTLTFDEMSQIGWKAPAGSNGVRCVPYINGVTFPNNPDAKSIYVGMGFHHGQPELIRSTMEGMIFILRRSLDVLRSVGLSPTSVIATGGGSKDELLVRIQADMYNLPVYFNLGKEISCMGAAISAAVGSGYYKDYREASEAIVRFSSKVIEPNPANVALYNELVPELDMIYESNRQYFK